MLRGAQLIAVASADGGATAVEGSSLPPDIQVQYVQLAPVADHTAAVQVKHTYTHRTQTLPGSYAHVHKRTICYWVAFQMQEYTAII